MYHETMFYWGGTVSRLIRVLLDRKHVRARPALTRHHSAQRGSRSAQKISGRIRLCKGVWKIRCDSGLGVGNDGAEKPGEKRGEKLCGFLVD